MTSHTDTAIADHDAENAKPAPGLLDGFRTKNQLARDLNCSLRTIDRRIASGDLVVVRFGGADLIDVEASRDRLKARASVKNAEPARRRRRAG